MAKHIKKLKYHPDNYSLRMMQSIEPTIIHESKQHYIAGYDREDVAQELRLHLWKKIHLYNPKLANFKTWSMQVIHNKLIDLHDLRSDVLDPKNIGNATGLDDSINHDTEGFRVE